MFFSEFAVMLLCCYTVILLCCLCNCLLLIEVFVAEIDVLKFFEIGFRQLLPAPRSWVGSCVWGMALGGMEHMIFVFQLPLFH